MKKVFFFFAFALVTNGLFSQDIDAYNRLNNRGDSLYMARAFMASAHAFRAAQEANAGNGTMNDFYVTGASYAMAGLPDSAFFYLEMALKSGYNEPTHLLGDRFLEPLHNELRWPDLVKKVKTAKADAVAKRDKLLTARLKKVLETHQGARQQQQATSYEKGKTSPEFMARKAETRRADSLNQREIALVLDEKGWLAPETISDSGSMAIYFVLLHGTVEFQKKYLPMMREAVKKGWAKAADLAMLEDRFLTRQGKPQLYGSQLKRDENGKMAPHPIADEKNLDKRRLEMGLGSMADYMNRYGVKYLPPNE